MYQASDHDFDEIMRWTWKRAVEWHRWPLFISLLIAPGAFNDADWKLVFLFIIGASIFWQLFVAPFFVSASLGGTAAFINWAQYLVAPLVAYDIWQSGRHWIALLALTWPVFGVWVCSIVCELASNAAGRLLPWVQQGEIGPLQRRLLVQVGMWHSPGMASQRAEIEDFISEQNGWVPGQNWPRKSWRFAHFPHF